MGGPLTQRHAEVECRSEHTYAQRPLAIWWHGQRLTVDALEMEWRTPRGRAFWVRCAPNLRFEVSYDEAENCWQVTLP